MSDIQDGAKRAEVIKNIQVVLEKWGFPHTGAVSPRMAEQIYDEVVGPEIIAATTAVVTAIHQGWQEILWSVV